MLVLGINADHKDPDADAALITGIDSDEEKYFPVRIHSVPGRGRGFFAARAIAKGEVVFKASPLCWAISEDWIANTCGWCFTYNDRRKHPVNASAGISEQKQLRKQSKAVSHYKGVFCTAECKQRAIDAHGGKLAWNRYICVLDSLEEEIHLRRSARTPQKKRKMAETKQPEAAPLDSADDGLADKLYAHPEFDPDDVSEAQLEQWISSVWDIIASEHLFSDGLPESDQRELVRLIANKLCLHDGLDKPQQYTQDSWQADAVSCSAVDGEIPSVSLLKHVRSNEVDYFRAQLHRQQLETQTPSDDAASATATIAPIRLPWSPTLEHIESSSWGAIFRRASLAYSLLDCAWTRANKVQCLGRLTHGHFRAVYYREMANSFGIWDPPNSLLPINEAKGALDFTQSCEQECLGFSIFPTAVYFNHSCAPNTIKLRVGREMQFVSNRAIECSEELFISYGNISDD
ncbi:hypothetical protein GGI12_004285, partial [Dipsacomyces acuminosporus]